jgi:hypothetical protein
MALITLLMGVLYADPASAQLQGVVLNDDAVKAVTDRVLLVLACRSPMGLTSPCSQQVRLQQTQQTHIGMLAYITALLSVQQHLRLLCSGGTYKHAISTRVHPHLGSFGPCQGAIISWL